MDQLKVQMHLSGHVSGLRLITSRYCSFPYFVFYLFSCLKIQRTHCTLCQDMSWHMSANRSFEITLLVQMTDFRPIKLCYFWHLFVDEAKEMGTNYTTKRRDTTINVSIDAIHISSLLNCHV